MRDNSFLSGILSQSVAFIAFLQDESLSELQSVIAFSRASGTLEILIQNFVGNALHVQWCDI